MTDPNRDVDIAYAFLKDMSDGHEPYGPAVAPAARMVSIIRKGMVREELDEILKPFSDFAVEFRNRCLSDEEIHFSDEVPDRIESIIAGIKAKYAEGLKSDG
jgi:hypothetical protein